MRIRTGSNQFFNNRQAEIAKAKSISNIDLSKAKFKRFCLKIPAWFRAKIYGKTKCKNELTANVTAFKTQEEAPAYNKKIDDFVNGLLSKMKQNAYTNFRSKLPNLTQSLETLSKKFAPQLGGNPAFNVAINAILNAAKPAEALAALKDFEETLNGVQIEVVDEKTFEFKTLIDALKLEFSDVNSQTKILLAADLDKMIAATTTWETSWKPIEHHLSPSDADRAKSLLAINEWAKKMKAQRATLLTAAPVFSGSFKKFGYFTDQLAEVKRIATLQNKEVANAEALEKSLINYFIDQTSSSWNAQKSAIGEAKKVTIAQNEAKIKQCQKEIEKRTGEEDAETLAQIEDLNYNVGLYDQHKQIYEALWLELGIDVLQADVKTGIQTIASLIKSIDSNPSSEHVASLAHEHYKAQLKADEVDLALSLYSARSKWTIIGSEPLEVRRITPEAGNDECLGVIDEAQEVMDSLDKLLEALNKVPALKRGEVTFKAWGEDANLSFDQAKALLLNVRKSFDAARMEADNRAMHLVSMQSTAEYGVQAELDALDAIFIDDLLTEYDRVTINNDGNCFFNAIIEGLKRLEDPRSEKYQVEGGAVLLRKDLFEYMKSHYNQYHVALQNQLCQSVNEYAIATPNEAGTLLEQAAEDMRPFYDEFRTAYLTEGANRDDLAEKMYAKCASPEIFELYANAMGEGIAFAALTELGVMSDMLGIRIGLHSQRVGNGLEVIGADDSPIIDVLRPTGRAHFDLLVKKPIIQEELS